MMEVPALAKDAWWCIESNQIYIACRLHEISWMSNTSGTSDLKNSTCWCTRYST